MQTRNKRMQAGEILLALRKAAHATQAAWAAKFAVSRYTVIRWEANQWRPSVALAAHVVARLAGADAAQVERLARALGVPYEPKPKPALPPPRPYPTEADRRASAERIAALQVALRDAAEELDVGVRALRRAMAKMVRAAKGGTIEELAGVLDDPKA